jgi:dephospho-CoA kinase
MKYVIGLTGNIGSGKSTVLSMLEQLGARAIDADELVHEVMRKGSPVWRAIVDTFGEGVLTRQGDIDRKKLGSFVFDDQEALGRLEEIVHPAVDERFREILDASEDSVTAVEAVKITQSSLFTEIDSLWLVTCPAEERLHRLLSSRDINAEGVEDRLRAQIAQERQAQIADVVIDNGASLEHTWQQVKAEWDKIWEQARPRRAVNVRRASRSDLDSITQIINEGSMGRVKAGRDAVLQRLFEWGYFVASTSKVMGVVGWQATNFVACLRDFYVYPMVQRRRMGGPLLHRVEQEAKALSCEVALLLVDRRSTWRATKFYREMGYERVRPQELIKAWREVAEEHRSADEMIFFKALREKRVMAPIQG